jgi:hypothetical protein
VVHCLRVVSCASVADVSSCVRYSVRVAFLPRACVCVALLPCVLTLRYCVLAFLPRACVCALRYRVLAYLLR